MQFSHPTYGTSKDHNTQQIPKRIPNLRTEHLRTLPYRAAHTYIAYIREYPPRAHTQDSIFNLVRAKQLSLHAIFVNLLSQTKQVLGASYSSLVFPETISKHDRYTCRTFRD